MFYLSPPTPLLPQAPQATPPTTVLGRGGQPTWSCSSAPLEGGRKGSCRAVRMRAALCRHRAQVLICICWAPSATWGCCLSGQRRPSLLSLVQEPHPSHRHCPLEGRHSSGRCPLGLESWGQEEFCPPQRSLGTPLVCSPGTGYPSWELLQPPSASQACPPRASNKSQSRSTERALATAGCELAAGEI